MLSRNQRGTKCFYPRKNEDVLAKKKNPYAIKKQDGEIRIIACDIAFVDKKRNDNSVSACIRLIPETVQYETVNEDGERVMAQSGYRRMMSYMEANKGGDVDKQAVRIKQLFADFEADYVVLDSRNGGILLYDRLAKVLYDEARHVEYRPWTCMNDENVANRVKTAGAEEVVYVISASPKLNSDIAITMRDVLKSERIDFLLDYQIAMDDVLSQMPEYTGAATADEMLFFERPYLETRELIGEMIELEYEKGKESGVFKIYEQGTNTKDRYTALSYGNYFAMLLENDMLSGDDNYETHTYIN